MKKCILIYPGNEPIGQLLLQNKELTPVDFIQRQFPDGESYFRLKTEITGSRVLILCSLHQPNDKMLPLIYMAETCRQYGAKEVILVAPYLSYMRQDKAFHPGESVTSKIFSSLISSHFEGLITIEPHLHRISSLSNIYSIPTEAISSAPMIAKWIKANMEKAFLIGPDEESSPWIEQISQLTGCPFVILEKLRLGDKDIKLKIPDLDRYSTYTPVLVDDIISTGITMMQAVKQLRDAGFNNIVCIATHAVFSGIAYDELSAAGASRIISTNTIPHASNRIDIAEALGRYL